MTLLVPLLSGQVASPSQVAVALSDEHLAILLAALDGVSSQLLSAPSDSDSADTKAWRGTAGALAVFSLRAALEARERRLPQAGALLRSFVVRQMLLVKTPGFGDYDLPSWWAEPSCHALSTAVVLGEPTDGLGCPPPAEVDLEAQLDSDPLWSTVDRTWWRSLGDDLYVDAFTGRPQISALHAAGHQSFIFSGGTLDGERRSLKQVLGQGSGAVKPDVLAEYELVGMQDSDELFADSACTWVAR